jgi:hypothetical protein
MELSMRIQIEIEGTQVELGLDKFVLSMPYPKKLKAELPKKLTSEQIEQHITEKAEFVANMHYIKNIVVDNFKHYLVPSKNKDTKRYNVFFDDGGLMFILSVGFCFGTGVLNIEINPSKLNQKQWQELTNWFDIFFNKGYEEFYTKAVVSHAEFFVDVPEEDISNLVLIDDTRRISTPYEGNTYLGKRESPRVSLMYDKAKQLELDEKLVRVEARINPKSLRLQDLVEGNQISPFGNDLVVNINQLQSISIAHGKAQFATRIKELGLNGSGIGKHSRKSIFAQLQKNAVSWWKPELFWSIHKDQLKGFNLLGKL